jgi:FG-GAP-like repeat
MRRAQVGRFPSWLPWCALALANVACAYKAVTLPPSSGSGGGSGSAGSGSAGSGSGGSGSAGSGTPGTAGSAGNGEATGAGGSTGAAGATVDAAAGAGAAGAAGTSGVDASGTGGDGAAGHGPTNPNLTYTKLTIHNRFLAESVAIGDYNHDGTLDIAAGRRWYAGPFVPNYNLSTGEHIYRDGHEDLPVTGAAIEINTGVSDSWAAYGYDVSGDGWDDIIQIAASDMGPMLAGQTPIPFGSGNWYLNPKNTGNGNWQKYQISADMKGEHKVFTDMTGDGKPEILGSCKSCKPIQTWGYWQADWANPTSQWTFHPVTRTYDYKDGCCGWLHGLGAGDVNGDGKPDLLERSGVWLQPATAAAPWTFINVAFSIPEFLGTQADIGGSHMYAYDVDGDGLTDIVSSLNSHGYGLAWFKQAPAGTFTRQMIMNTPAEMGMYNNVAVSQLHSLCLEDMDGDGLKDIVTGKTFLAHPYATGDAGNMDPVQLYIFKLVRTPTVHFEPHLIDADTATMKGSGVARQFTVVDMNKDGINDFVISSKRGLFVYLGKP